MKNFDDITVSTHTIIGNSNIKVKDMEYLFENIIITPFTLIEKRRGRKRKGEITLKEDVLSDGSIITAKFGNNIRGVDAKKNNKKSKKTRFFRNALTIVMFVEGKKINFKITRNGKFQFTGCKNVEQAKKSVKHIWKNFNKDNIDRDRLFDIKGDFVSIYFLIVMTNIDFNLGFNVNREFLDRYINSNTLFNSLLETSFGYTGVNIKIPVITGTDFVINGIKLINDEWIDTDITYKEYIKNIPEDEREKLLRQKRYNTFLIFQSGNVIMSGYNKTYMKDVYYKFGQLLINSREHIEENL